jgi:hypothetical protein
VLDQKRLTGLMREIAREDHWKRYEETLDFDFADAMGDEARFRVNYLGQLHGYGCVLRHIPAKVLTLTDLGAPEVLKNLPQQSVLSSPVLTLLRQNIHQLLEMPHATGFPSQLPDLLDVETRPR